MTAPVGPRPPARRLDVAWGSALGAVLAAALLVATALWIAQHDVSLKLDSRSYLRSDVQRSAGYPAFIQLVRLGSGHRFRPVLVALQSALGLAAAALLAAYLRRRFRLAAPAAIAVLAILLSPYWTLLLGNQVLSQALAYPLLLLAFRFLLAAVLDGDERAWLVYLALAAACVLTRPQLVFLHAASLAALVVLLRRPRPPLRRALLAAAFGAALLLAPLADRAWRWSRHGVFAGLPYTGQQLIAGALYIAQPGDARLFEGKTRSLFVELYARAEQEQLLMPRRIGRRLWRPLPGVTIPVLDVRHFGSVYNALAWGIGFETTARRYCPGCARYRRFLAVDPPLRQISLALIRAHLARRFQLYYSTLLAAARPTEWLLLAVALAAALVAGLRRGDAAGHALTLAILLHLANLGLVAGFEPELERYTFLTGTLYLAALTVFLLRPFAPAAAAGAAAG